MKTKHAFQNGIGLVPAHRHVNPNGSRGGWIADSATVASTAIVRDDAVVYGNASVRDNAVVRDSAIVSGRAIVRGHAIVSERAHISGCAYVRGGARVRGHAMVRGRTIVWGSARICGGDWKTSPLQIQGSRYFVNFDYVNGGLFLRIGCEVHSIEHWQASINKIGKKHHCSQEEIEEYQEYVALASKLRPH